jgi:hypothetical protein
MAKGASKLAAKLLECLEVAGEYRRTAAGVADVGFGVRIRDVWEIVEPLGHLACISGKMRSEGAEFAGVGECGPRLLVGKERVAVGVGDRERVDVGYVVDSPYP